MFIYEFKNPSRILITKIVISGFYLTLYTSKALSQELNPMIKAFGLSNIRFTEDPAHIYCHHPYIEFSALGDGVPHKHLILPTDKERVNSLRELLHFLVERQSNFSLRQQDYQNFVTALETERKSYGHKTFPLQVQEASDQYDTKTPFILEEEVDRILSSFIRYTNDPHYLKLEAINN